jgi:hypothetical protein
MRDNILTLTYKGNHRYTFILLRIGATILSVLLAPIIIPYIVYNMDYEKDIDCDVCHDLLNRDL